MSNTLIISHFDIHFTLFFYCCEFDRLLYSLTYLKDGEKCFKEDIIGDWNSPPIYDIFPNEDYELGKQQVEEYNDETFFVQIQKVVDFTKDYYPTVIFIVVAIK